MKTSHVLFVRRARRDDLRAIVAMLADDVLGRERESTDDPVLAGYIEAFEEIESDPQQTLVVGEVDGQVVATLQVTMLRHLSHRGARRAHVEAVRVRSDWRGRRIGEQLMEWAIARARDTGCRVVQLTTNVQRTDAQRFYERLGFTRSHVGMTLALTAPRD